MKLPKGEIIPLKTDFMFCHIFNDPDNIEISNALDDGIKNRNVVFLSKIHAKNIKHGETNAYTYNNIQKSLQINLVSHNINESDLIETFYLRNDKGKKLTEKLQIDYIDMTKADKVCYNENTKEEKIRKWCLLIMTKSKKGFKKGYDEGMEKASKDKSLDFAKKSFSKGIDIETISQITDLSIEEIEKLL